MGPGAEEGTHKGHPYRIWATAEDKETATGRADRGETGGGRGCPQGVRLPGWGQRVFSVKSPLGWVSEDVSTEPIERFVAAHNMLVVVPLP